MICSLWIIMASAYGGVIWLIDGLIDMQIWPIHTIIEFGPLF